MHTIHTRHPSPHPSRRPDRRTQRHHPSVSSLAGRAAVALVAFGTLALLWHYLSENRLLEAALVVAAAVFALIDLSQAGWS